MTQLSETPMTTSEAHLVPVTAVKSVDEYITQFEKEGKTPIELEAFVRKYQNTPESALSDELLKQLLAAVKLHRRTTAGPPKTEGKKAAAKKAPVDLGSLL